MKAGFVGFTGIVSSIIFSGVVAQAQCDRLEAQVIAQVQKLIAQDQNTCTVTLGFSGRNSQLNSHYACPLDVDDLSNGVTLSKTQGACPVQSGDSLSGVLYKSLTGEDSRIFLE